MTTDTRAPGPPSLDLARLDDRQLKKRIELNRDARYGLEAATPDQLNVVFVLCRRWQLDPVTDITLYQGHPWVTLDGWCRVVRRHPEWTTLRQYPLPKAEKLDWGYSESDIVVATVIGTKNHGEITGYGKVTAAEIDEARAAAQKNNRRAAPIGMHPVEMATKRSLARAARIALGLDIPDETIVEQEVTEFKAERADPVRNKQLADQYTQVFGTDDQDQPPPPALEPARTPPVVAPRPAPQDDDEDAEDEDDDEA